LGVYRHKMGIKDNGRLAILAGAGPMGLGMVDYALHTDRKPSFIVVTDIDQERLDRARDLFSEAYAAKLGVALHYVNTKEEGEQYILELTGGQGFDDIFVLAPVKPVIEMGNKLMGQDCCLNFFAGPTDTNLSADFNFYNVHYASTHVCGNSGGNTEDMKEALSMMAKGKLNPSVMVTHIGGLNAVIETTLNLPKIPGGKKLIYTQIDLPLTAITEFEEKGKTDPLFAELAKKVERTKGLWNREAEEYLLGHGKPVEIK
jgi:Threonine dehydrogenase and related Zn-dependent dehydrogenases